MIERKGLIHIYTGDGKGKTTASMGLALRAIGQGFKVCVIQFMKGGAYTGEFISAKNFLPNFTFAQYGRPCIKEDKQYKLLGIDKDHHYFDYIRGDIECGTCRWCFANDEQQQKYVGEAYEHSKKIIEQGNYDIVILDEINVAVSLNFLTVDEILKLIDIKPKNTELIITGRNVHPKIVEKADLVTEMKMVKHYFNQGVAARRGIEY